MPKRDWTDAEVDDIYLDRYNDEYFDEAENPGEVEKQYRWSDDPDYPKAGERDWEW